MNAEVQTILEQINAGRAEIKAATDRVQSAAKAAFSAGVKSLFEEHPIVHSISWTQYTPYFNDGDECVFSSHHEYADMLFSDGLEYDGYGSVTSEKKSAYNAFQAFLANFHDQDFRAMFDDHVKVTVTPDGVNVSEYRHD